MTTDAVARAAAALNRQQTVRGLLETACRELVETPDASACAISRVVGDLLVALAARLRSPPGSRPRPAAGWTTSNASASPRQSRACC